MKQRKRHKITVKRNEKFYLLACYLLYACFIRPSEICKLKISDISFKNQTYSLKDTGITKMISLLNVAEVRD